LEEIVLSTSDPTCRHGEPVADALQDTIVEAFIAATRDAIGEMANTNITVGAVHRKAIPNPPGDVVALVGLRSATEAWFALAFPKQTVKELAERMLRGTAPKIDDDLIQDCAGEIANVVTGQAKALLGDSPLHFSSSIPKVMSANELPPTLGPACRVVEFISELGPLALHLFLPSVTRP
jgi:CheY-specific phosphatase CheX